MAGTFLSRSTRNRSGIHANPWWESCKKRVQAVVSLAAFRLKFFFPASVSSEIGSTQSAGPRKDRASPPSRNKRSISSSISPDEIGFSNSKCNFWICSLPPASDHKACRRNCPGESDGCWITTGGGVIGEKTSAFLISPDSGVGEEEFGERPRNRNPAPAAPSKTVPTKNNRFHRKRAPTSSSVGRLLEIPESGTEARKATFLICVTDRPCPVRAISISSARPFG